MVFWDLAGLQLSAGSGEEAGKTLVGEAHD